MNVNLTVAKDANGEECLIVTLAIPFTVGSILTLLKANAPTAWRKAERELILPPSASTCVKLEDG